MRESDRFSWAGGRCWKFVRHCQLPLGMKKAQLHMKKNITKPGSQVFFQEGLWIGWLVVMSVVQDTCIWKKESISLSNFKLLDLGIESTFVPTREAQRLIGLDIRLLAMYIMYLMRQEALSSSEGSCMFLDQFPMNCRVGLNLGSKASSMQVPTLEFCVTTRVESPCSHWKMQLRARNLLCNRFLQAKTWRRCQTCLSTDACTLHWSCDPRSCRLVDAESIQSTVLDLSCLPWIWSPNFEVGTAQTSTKMEVARANARTSRETCLAETPKDGRKMDGNSQDHASAMGIALLFCSLKEKQDVTFMWRFPETTGVVCDTPATLQSNLKVSDAGLQEKRCSSRVVWERRVTHTVPVPPFPICLGTGTRSLATWLQHHESLWPCKTVAIQP